jgi:tetratricopeptide (TPR) repeat protein
VDTSSQAPKQTIKLVEREEPMARLRRFWNDAKEGRGRVVLLAGEAGHGKSCLANEIISELDADPTAHKTARAVCSAQSGKDEAFWPFAEVFGQLAANPRRKLTEDLLDSLFELAPDWIGMIPVAGNIVGATIKTAQVIRAKTRGSDEPNPEKLLREYVGALEKVCDKQTVLIFIDDLHWSDAASIKLLSHLSRHIGQMKALVIGAFRPSDIAVESHALNTLIDDIERYDSEAVISLPPLSEEGVATLVNSMLSPNKFPPSFPGHIHRNTGGSPLFIVESIRLMQAQKEIYRDAADQKWTLAAQWEDDLPRSVEAVIGERIDRLPEELLEALTLASVQGVTFEAAVLAHIMERDEVKLMKLLEPAERVHGLIEYKGDVELDNDITTRYQFVSNLFHRALSQRLRGKHKMIAFRRTAEGMDKLWPDDNEDLAARLAGLYETGKQFEKAAYFSVIAARKCRRAGEVTCAIDLLEDAEKMLERAGKRDAVLQAEIDESLSHLYEVDASFDKAMVRTQRAIAPGIAQLGWRKWTVFQKRLARLADHDMRFNDMLALLEESRELQPDTEEDKYSREAFMLSMEYTRALVRVSRADEAITHCEEALARTASVADVAQRESLRAHLNGALAMALYYNGQYDRCITVAESVLPLARRQLQHSTARSVLTSLVNWCIATGKYDRAEKHVREMHDLAKSSSDESLAALAHLLHGKLNSMLGNHIAALKAYDEAESLVAVFKSFPWRPELLAMKAWALVDQRMLGEARALLLKAGPLARASGSREWVGNVQIVQARFDLVDGEIDSALGRAETAEQIFREENARYDQARALRIMARCQRALGAEDKAVRLFQRAADLFEQLGNAQQLEVTKKQWGV